RVALSCRTAWRTSRSEPPVLEIAVRLGPHDRALEGEHSAGGSAGDHLCGHCRDTTHHDADDQCAAARERCERHDVGTATAGGAIGGPPLRSHRAGALARAHLWLADARLGMVAAQRVSMCGAA